MSRTLDEIEAKALEVCENAEGWTIDRRFSAVHVEYDLAAMNAMYFSERGLIDFEFDASGSNIDEMYAAMIPVWKFAEELDAWIKQDA